MKKSYLASIIGFVVIVLVVLSIVFTPRIKSKKYYNEAEKIINKTSFTEWNSDSVEIKKAHELLDKSIESNKKWWNPYIQKIQLYRVPNYDMNIEPDYEKVIQVYELWLKNGNSFSAWQKFTYACALFSVGKKDDSLLFFKEDMNDLQSIKKNTKNEISIMAGLLSGIALGEISSSNVDEYAKEYESCFKEPEKVCALLDDAVNNDVDEFIKTYAGAM